MFRCKECQTEYEIKPDYCDCGNDTFEEVVVKPQETLKTPKSETVKLNIPKIPEKPVSQTVTKAQPSYDYSRIKAFFDPAFVPLSSSEILVAIRLKISSIAAFAAVSAAEAAPLAS